MHCLHVKCAIKLLIIKKFVTKSVQTNGKRQKKMIAFFLLNPQQNSNISAAKDFMRLYVPELLSAFFSPFENVTLDPIL